ncbi:MAG: GTPase Era [Clostridia bacterium]|nr:GTPase Era [Clostridia bacterium]
MIISSIALVGRANVGKSTLMNALVGEKIAIVSNKPQTTRGRITGIYTDNSRQIVFYDTPGIHEPKNKLGGHMVKAATGTLNDVDAVILVVEPRKPGKTEIKLCERLKGIDIPTLLVINKIDTVDKDAILSVISSYSVLMDFDSVIPVSAKTGDGVDLVLSEIKKYGEDGDPLFPDDIATTMTMRELASEIIREKFLLNLRDEIPHGIAVDIVEFKSQETTKGEPISEISADIICERNAHKSIIIGKNGEMLKKCVSAARIDMERLFDEKVFLKCFVKVRENWRDDDKILNDLGF